MGRAKILSQWVRKVKGPDRSERGWSGTIGPAESSSNITEALVLCAEASELAVGAACWLCGGRSSDCESSLSPQLEEQYAAAPVTPEQKTIGITQVMPDKADGTRRSGELRFSIGSVSSNRCDWR